MTMETNGLSGSEVGGLFAGIVAAVVAIGHGARWLLGWGDRRELARHEKLNKWQAELEAREASLDKKLVDRMQVLEATVPELVRIQAKLTRMVDRWRIAFKIVAAELAANVPHSVALLQAQTILADAEHFDPLLPVDWTEMLASLEKRHLDDEK